MHRLNFRDVLEIQPWEHLTKIVFASARCADVARAYRSNIERSHRLALIPGHAFMDGENWKAACDRAMKELGTSDPLDARVPEPAVRLYKEREATFSTQQKCDHFREATDNADLMWSEFDTMPRALHDLLQTMVINALTAFEVLVEGLWYAAVAERPSLESAMTNEERGKIGFRSRRRFRKSYELIFTSDVGSIHSLLLDQSIDAAALVRNVLVHVAGKTDDDFRTGAKGIPILAQWEAAPEGTEIEFTGSFTRGLIDPLTPLGYSLVKEVDDWLKRNP